MDKLHWTEEVELSLLDVEMDPFVEKDPFPSNLFFVSLMNSFATTESIPPTVCADKD